MFVLTIFTVKKIDSHILEKKKEKLIMFLVSSDNQDTPRLELNLVNYCIL